MKATDKKVIPPLKIINSPANTNKPPIIIFNVLTIIVLLILCIIPCKGVLSQENGVFFHKKHILNPLIMAIFRVILTIWDRKVMQNNDFEK